MNCIEAPQGRSTSRGDVTTAQGLLPFADLFLPDMELSPEGSNLMPHCQGHSGPGQAHATASGAARGSFGIESSWMHSPKIVDQDGRTLQHNGPSQPVPKQEPKNPMPARTGEQYSDECTFGGKVKREVHGTNVQPSVSFQAPFSGPKGSLLDHPLEASFVSGLPSAARSGSMWLPAIPEERRSMDSRCNTTPQLSPRASNTTTSSHSAATHQAPQAGSVTENTTQASPGTCTTQSPPAGGSARQQSGYPGLLRRR